MGKTDQKIDVELSRELSLFHITMMGVGMMIGAGVLMGPRVGLSLFAGAVFAWAVLGPYAASQDSSGRARLVARRAMTPWGTWCWRS